MRHDHPDGTWTRDVAVGDVVFQLVRRSGSAFVGMLRMGRVHGGELYGYIARMNSERSEVRLFPRHVGWHGNAAAVDALGSVLERRVGDDIVMRAQYEYLLRLAEQPNVTIQMVLPERGPHAAVNAGSFEIFHFRHASPAAYVELFDNALYVRETQNNRTYRLFAKEVMEHALSPEDSVREIERFRAALK